MYLRYGAALAVTALVVPAGVPQAVGHLAVNGSAAVAVCVGVRRHRAELAGAWYLVAVGLALFAASNLGWAVEEAGRRGAAGPAGAALRWWGQVDAVLKTSALVALGAAMAQLLRAGRFTVRPARGLDGVLVAVGATLLLGQLAVLTERALGSGPTVRTLAAGALVALSLAAGTVGVRLVTAGGDDTAWGLLMLAGACGLLGPAVLVSVDPFTAPRWTDATWLVMSTLVGTAALHPTMAASRERPAPVGGRQLPAARLGLVTAALLANPVVLWLTLVHGDRHLLLLPLQAVAMGAVTVLGIGGLAEVSVPGSRTTRGP